MPVLTETVCPGCGLTLFFAVKTCPACGKPAAARPAPEINETASEIIESPKVAAVVTGSAAPEQPATRTPDETKDETNAPGEAHTQG